MDAGLHPDFQGQPAHGLVVVGLHHHHVVAPAQHRILTQNLGPVAMTIGDGLNQQIRVAQQHPLAVFAKGSHQEIKRHFTPPPFRF